MGVNQIKATGRTSWLSRSSYLFRPFPFARVPRVFGLRLFCVGHFLRRIRLRRPPWHLRNRVYRWHLSTSDQTQFCLATEVWRALPYVTCLTVPAEATCLESIHQADFDSVKRSDTNTGNVDRKAGHQEVRTQLQKA